MSIRYSATRTQATTHLAKAALADVVLELEEEQRRRAVKVDRLGANERLERGEHGASESESGLWMDSKIR